MHYRLLMLILCLAMMQPSLAARHEQGHMRGQPMTLGGAVSHARQQYNGRVISAETGQKGQHNIKILTEDGRVKRLRYDSKTGRSDQSRGR